MRIATIMTFVILLQAMPSQAAPVVRDGIEWLQPNLFTNLSWNEIDAVCPAGVCVDGGSLNGVDLTGFLWATYLDLDELYQSYGAPPVFPTAVEEDSIWAPAILADFPPTSINPAVPSSELISWVSGGSPGQAMFVVDRATGIDYVAFGGSGEDEANPDFGATFYRRVRAIPTMSTFGHVFTVLGLLIAASLLLFRRKIV